MLVNGPQEQRAIANQNGLILGRGLVLMGGDGGAAVYIPVKLGPQQREALQNVLCCLWLHVAYI